LNKTSSLEDDSTSLKKGKYCKNNLEDSDSYRNGIFRRHFGRAKLYNVKLLIGAVESFTPSDGKLKTAEERLSSIRRNVNVPRKVNVSLNSK
jgi:hypothetical protein